MDTKDLVDELGAEGPKHGYGDGIAVGVGDTEGLQPLGRGDHGENDAEVAEGE